MIKTRICTQCSVEKPLNEYSNSGSRSGQRKRYNCKDCQNKAAKKNYWKNPEKSRLRQCLIKYDLTEVEYRAMLLDQDFKCKICGIKEIDLKKRLVIDHCHSTGRVRGLLCYTCNTTLGLWEKSRQLIEMFEEYLNIPGQAAESDRSARD